MARPDTREATFGIITYLLFGAALGASILLGTLVLGLEAIGDLVGAGFRERIVSGEAEVLYLYAFFVIAPLFGLVIAGLLGMRAARTGHEIGGTAVATTLYGLPILWFNLAIAMLLATAILDWTGATDDRFDVTLSLVIESAVFLILESGVVAGFAAIAAGVSRDAFRTPRETPALRQTVMAPEPEPIEAAPRSVPEPALGPHATPPLVDHPVECPRCHTEFHVSGTRPLRIECPQCGKSGLIH